MKLFMVILFFLLPGLSFSQIHTDSTKYVAYYSARVMDSDNYPILFAFISADGAESTFNDPTGRFVLQFTSLSFDPDSSAAYPLVSYYHPDYEERSEYIKIREGDSIVGSDIVLTPKLKGRFTVSGTVKFDNNEPVTNTNVYIYNNVKCYYAEIGPDGNYSIQINEGSYYAAVGVYYHLGSAWTFRDGFYNNKQDLRDADLLIVNQDLNGINFIFPTLKQGKISGKVRDAVTGQPISYVGISVASTDPRDSSFSGTDQDGNYSIEVFEGDYIVFAYKDGYYKQYYLNAYNTFDAAPVSVDSANLNVSGIDFDLTKPESGTNILSGFLSDGSVWGPAEVSVFAIPLSGGKWFETKTGFDGKFILRDIPNGRYIVLFSKENYISKFFENSYMWEDAYIFNLEENQHISTVSTYMEPLVFFGGEISGKITSASGKPVSGTLISAVDSSGKSISSGLSAYDGNYLISKLRDGSYKLKASKTGYPTTGLSEEILIDLNSTPVVDGQNISFNTTNLEGARGQIPVSLRLYQNYPNPFNPSTKIQYEIPFEANVEIKIYDVLGREVETLVNENKLPGSYEVEWNADKVFSGIYFCKLSAGSYSSVRKMIYLR